MTTLDEQKGGRLANRILERIKGERLTPRPRWEFLVKDYFFWILGVFAVILGAFAVTAMLFEITNVDWRLSVATHSSFLSFLLASAPLFWIIALILFICIGYLNVRRTNHGYRYPLTIIALGAVLTSLALGTSLYTAGFGRVVEEVIGDHPPFYRPIITAERSWWLAPEKGLLGGQIISVAPHDVSFVLSDFSGRSWKVDESDLHTPDLAAVARGGIVRVVGLPVQTNAASTTNATFHACFVFSWEMHGDFQNKPSPLPLMIIASTSEKSATTTDRDVCKNIRPYQQLRSIDDANL